MSDAIVPRANEAHWFAENRHENIKAMVGLAAMLCACGPPGSNFPAASARDVAECRILMRIIANSCYSGEGLGVAMVCRSQAGDAYDDCMIAKGYTVEDEAEEPNRERFQVAK